MIRSRRSVVVVLLTLALAAIPAASVVADGGGNSGSGNSGSGGGNSGGLPQVVTQYPGEVRSVTAILRGTVKPSGSSTTFWFEYGTTSAYGSTTPAAPVSSQGSVQQVASPLTALEPGTTYHFRVVARNPNGTSFGADKFFTTDRANHPGNRNDGVAGHPGVHPGNAPPDLNRTVSLRPLDGRVRVRTPGRRGFQPVEDLTTVPVGSVVDASGGTVRLTSELPGGREQAGTFSEGLFQVRQPRGDRGMTELHLRGALDCRATNGLTRGFAVASRRRSRRLWARDRRGRFRTHGRNSVATVRGTAWLTTDRCSGTLTWVREGQVAVRDLRRHRTVTVRAGHAYFARAPR